MNDVLPFVRKLPISKDKIFEAERRMRERGTPVEIPVNNYFGGGVYAREIVIPAETILTGQIHKKENLNLLSSGVIHVSTENGVQRLVGPTWIVSPPGTKRIAYTETEVRWVTFHATEERDLEKIEQLFIAKTEAEFVAYVEEQKRLGGAAWRG